MKAQEEGHRVILVRIETNPEAMRHACAQGYPDDARRHDQPCGGRCACMGTLCFRCGHLRVDLRNELLITWGVTLKRGTSSPSTVPRAQGAEGEVPVASPNCRAISTASWNGRTARAA